MSESKDIARKIIEVEKIIKLKRKVGKDATFEEELVKSWRKFFKQHYPTEPLPDALRATRRSEKD